ncbi:hypothetical protein [Pseudomonas sp. VE 196-7]|uniref:hypothetical protein n=1 Tax=Pseudomonas sp. VE 196-7 TaxID=2956726 RepID=UPI0021D5088D|nr:hypothetical protein [Pseudomonas sp. VE 196-7]MCU7217568.1 hypothetical protein [Pseudomonas sp. VE 196-7]
MTRTYDHESGEAVDEGFLTKNAGKFAAAALATTAVPMAMNSADIVKVAGKILTFIGKNPKVALGVGALGVFCYGIHRVTEPGTKIKKTEDGFEYERSQ